MRSGTTDRSGSGAVGVILRSAILLTDQHGEDASLEAAMRADAMLEKGAIADAAAICRIDHNLYYS